MPQDLLYMAVVGVGFATSAVAAGHALLRKRDPRAALAWIAACVLFPFIGPLLYFGFGINRIRMRAHKLGAAPPTREKGVAGTAHPSVPPPLAQLDRVGRALTGREISAGNRIELLHNGEEAFPVMLEAISRARTEILLATYIFETNETGRRFIDALATASNNGVRVRVLVDGIGELYSFPWATRLLRKRNVTVARFLPPRLFPPALRVNLRNHRKVMVVDGSTGFTGGMNIGDRYLAERRENRRPVVDLHARVTGGVVDELRRVFLEDWRWVTGEELAAVPKSAPPPAGTALCRIIADGPSEDLEKLEMVLAVAVSLAMRQVRIMTPYFLPPRSLIAALQGAALRGVEVTILLPEKNNLPYVHWATRKMLWEILGRGVRVLYQPGPFVHTKLFAIDDDYVLLGSSNIDARSLRLNFELVLEAYDRVLAREVVDHFDRIATRSREVTLEEMDERSIPAKLRDALAWLASPYL